MHVNTTVVAVVRMPAGNTTGPYTEVYCANGDVYWRFDGRADWHYDCNVFGNTPDIRPTTEEKI